MPTEKFVVITDNIVKMSDNEYKKQQEKIKREKMTLEEINAEINAVRETNNDKP